MDISDLSDVNFTLYRDGTLVLSRNGRRNFDVLPVKPKQVREYKIKRMLLRSACVNLWQVKRSKYLLFFTVTDPFDLDEKQFSKIWNNFLNNLRNHYEVKNYVWIKERQKRGNIHYHILVDRNRINIKVLQKTFNECVFNVVGRYPVYNNTVRLGYRPVVRSIHSVKGYLSKYVSKGTEIFKSKAYGLSQGIVFKRKIDVGFALELAEKYKFVLVIDDSYFRIYRIVGFYDTG